MMAPLPRGRIAVPPFGACFAHFIISGITKTEYEEANARPFFIKYQVCRTPIDFSRATCSCGRFDLDWSAFKRRKESAQEDTTEREQERSDATS